MQLGQEETSLWAATFATNSGKLLLKNGDLEGPISQFRAAINSLPSYAVAYYQLALALAQKSQKEESSKEFQTASELDSPPGAATRLWGSKPHSGKQFCRIGRCIRLPCW
ncbi:MAG: hypothetical protein LAO23_07020 [Acidobacteriia bacterium]|nr:hypothetical protein [Terriglobia bacterium]